MSRDFKIFSELIIKIVKNIHKELGPGFTESVYQGALAIELRRYKINYLKEMSFEIFYRNHVAGEGRLDFFINDPKLPKFIIETKSTRALSDTNRSQITSYLLSAPLNSNEDLKDTTFGVLINWPGATVNNDEAVLVNNEPEIEFYTRNKKTVSLLQTESI